MWFSFLIKDASSAGSEIMKDGNQQTFKMQRTTDPVGPIPDWYIYNTPLYIRLIKHLGVDFSGFMGEDNVRQYLKVASGSPGN